MIDFYAYKPNGEIVMTGQVPEFLLQYQSVPGAEIAVGRAELGKHYVDNGVLKELPPRPSEYHVFDYDTKVWVLDVEAAWRAVRRKRDELLAACDWTQLPDVPLKTKTEWAIYRQALRDITEQPDPLNIQWPQPPQL